MRSKAGAGASRWEALRESEGAYYVRASDGTSSKAKKLIIH